jgi:hypothetical protein
MMEHAQEMTLGVVFIAVYVLGGIATFSGLFLVGFMSGQDLLGWGDGKSLGYLFICVGLCMSIAAVMFMKTLRSRGRS